jgi:hypothetical protein
VGGFGVFKRLKPDDSLDQDFYLGPKRSVHALMLQADGKIVVGGAFTELGGLPRNNIGRLNPAGSLDMGFNPGADYTVRTLALQADGKIVVGGYFTELGWQPLVGIHLATLGLQTGSGGKGEG